MSVKKGESGKMKVWQEVWMQEKAGKRERMGGLE